MITGTIMMENISISENFLRTIHATTPVDPDMIDTCRTGTLIDLPEGMIVSFIFTTENDAFVDDSFYY